MTLIFNPERYQDKMREAQERFASAYNFEEADRVPVRIGFEEEAFCRLYNCTLKDYLTDLDACLGVQLQALKWQYEVLDDDRFSYGVSPYTGAIKEGILFDCEIRLPDDENPWLTPWIIPKLKDPEDIERLEVPDPWQHPSVKRYYEMYEKMKCKVGNKIPVHAGFQIHPPLSAAGSLMGTDRLYIHLYRYPKLMHRFFRKLLRTFFELQEYHDEYFGTTTESIGLSDDHAGFLPVKLYREFVLPYNKQMYERYGKNGRSLHMDSEVSPALARILADELKITHMDLGGGAHGRSRPHDFERIKKAFDGKVVSGGGIFVETLVDGSRESIKKAVEYCMQSAASGGGFHFTGAGGGAILDVGGRTSIERILYLVFCAKKLGKYPTRVE